MHPTEVVALVAASLIALVTTPAGISGAVLLLPFQVTGRTYATGPTRYPA